MKIADRNGTGLKPIYVSRARRRPSSRKVLMDGVIEWLSTAARSISWYVTSLMGDRAYETYVDHHRARHPDIPAFTERQFWIERYQHQDDNPGSRCC